jgi:hypothetical protein
MRLVSLFQIGREHAFDPFHECADSARQVATVRYNQGDIERLAGWMDFGIEGTEHVAGTTSARDVFAVAQKAMTT